MRYIIRTLLFVVFILTLLANILKFFFFWMSLKSLGFSMQNGIRRLPLDCRQNWPKSVFFSLFITVVTHKPRGFWSFQFRNCATSICGPKSDTGPMFCSLTSVWTVISWFMRLLRHWLFFGHSMNMENSCEDNGSRDSESRIKMNSLSPCFHLVPSPPYEFVGFHSTSYYKWMWKHWHQ